jgi:hypothetical protein
MTSVTDMAESYTREASQSVETASERALAEVCHRFGASYVPQMTEVVYATVNCVLTGFRRHGSPLDPMVLRDATDKRFRIVIDAVNEYLVTEHFKPREIPLRSLFHVIKLSGFAPLKSLS